MDASGDWSGSSGLVVVGEEEGEGVGQAGGWQDGHDRRGLVSGLYEGAVGLQGLPDHSQA